MQERDLNVEKILKEFNLKYEEQEQKNQDILMSSVRPLLTQSEFNDIRDMIDEYGNTYDYSIEDEPKGDYQEEDYDFIKGAWVNQTTNGGFTGDEFAGTVSIKLPNGKYFQFYYSL